MTKWIITLEQFILENKREYKDQDGKELPYQEVLKMFDYLRKEQKYIPLFFDMYSEEGKSHDELKSLYKELTDHKNTIKQFDIDVTKAEKFEDVVDILSEVDLIEKTNKYLKKIPNPLRQKLKSNKENFNRFRDAIIDYDYEDYKNVFLKKIAKYQDRPVEDFFNYLSGHLKSFADIKDTFEKIKKDPDAQIIYFDEDEFLIAMIFSKDGSCNLGSKQWCISDTKYNYWSNYITRNGKAGVQYFVWDLTEEGVQSQVGITLYDKNDYTAHYKDDSAARNLENKDFFKYLKTWDEIEDYQKIKYLADNEGMGKFAGDLFNNLSNEDKKKYLMKYPKLVRLYDDIDFLTTEEITNLIKTDVRVGKHESVAKSLNMEQKIYAIINYPDLLESATKKYYIEATPKLTSDQKLEMITNKHSLYNSVELTEEELYKLINLDPTILVSHTKIATSRADNEKLRQMYIDDRDRWDKLIEKANSEDTISISLLLAQLIKGTDRLKKESENFYFFFLANKKEVDGTEYLVPKQDTPMIMIEDHLNPVNLDLTMLMLSRKEGDSIYYTMLPRDVYTEEKYTIETSLEEYLAGEGSDQDRDIIKQVQEYNKPMG